MTVVQWFEYNWKYFLMVLVVLLFAFFLTRLTSYFLKKFFKLSSRKLRIDPTRFNFIKNATNFIIYTTALIVIFTYIPSLKSFGLTLLAGAGVFAAIVGFASQQAFSNIISGIFLVIFKPFRVDDYLSIGDLHTGIVEDITLRHTVIRNFENRRIIIPNAIISSETLVNSSINDERICVFLELGISYDSDVDKAIQIIREEVKLHPDYMDIRSQEEINEGKPGVIVRLIRLNESSVDLRAYVWAPNPLSAFSLKCDLFKSIKSRFTKEGIEIPFPHRTIVMKPRAE